MKLTKQAKSMLELMQKTVELTEEDVKKDAAEALASPGDSYWHDEDMWVTHTMMFATPDWDLTDEYIIDQSNYRVALEELEASHSNDVEAATFGHWTYSRYQAIKVRVLNSKGNVTAAFVHALALARSTRDYPILDESHYSELEYEVLDNSIIQAIEFEKKDREVAGKPELTPSQIEKVHELLMEDANYAGDGLNYDLVAPTFDRVLTGNYKLHQDAELQGAR